LQLSQETCKLVFRVPVKSSGDISAEPVRGQKIVEHVTLRSTQLDDENRPSLTSGAVAGKRQVSSENTVDEMADAITAYNDIGLWSTNIPEEMKYWLKNETGSLTL